MPFVLSGIRNDVAINNLNSGFEKDTEILFGNLVDSHMTLSFRNKKTPPQEMAMQRFRIVYVFYFLDITSILTLQQTATKKPPATSTDGK
jgi:hypothetical protein